MSLMTLEEKVALLDAAQAAEDAGDDERAKKLLRQIPLSPNLARGLLESQGLDAALAAGFNLSEAEAHYGSAWLQQFRA